MNENDLISIAKILNFHGIKGDVKVGFTKGKEANLQATKKMFIFYEKNILELNVESVRFHKQHALIKFKEINTVNDAEKYKGLSLSVLKSDIIKNLDDDEYLITDLIGMDVYDQNDDLVGVIVEIADNQATNILAVKSSNDPEKKYLIPFVKEIVPIVDIKNRKMLVNSIEGLLE